MHYQPLLTDITIVFVAALLGGLVAEALRQSPLIGYILGGTVIGPYATGLVQDVGFVNAFAEIGIILLMFTLGIEFSLSRLAKVRRIAIAGGLLQIVVQVAVITLLHEVLGLSLYTALFLGCTLAISSTMIVSRALGDQGQLDSKHGQIMIGLLVVQDLAVVIMVAVLPRIGNSGTGDYPHLLGTLALSLGLTLALTFVAQKVVPPLMERAARGSNQDVFLILALSLGLGIAFLAQAAGTSLSLGAFLAGLVVSESDYAHEVLGKIASLKDAFVILFFVSIGMMINVGAVFTNLPLLGIVLILIMPLKLVLFYAITRLFGYHRRISFQVGMGMLQTGEFSFVMAKLGYNSGVIGTALYNVILASSLITMLATPQLVRMAPVWYGWISRRFRQGAGQEEGLDCEGDQDLANHVIICGYGRVGNHVGFALSELEVPFTVIDYDYNIIVRLQKAGIPCVYGDAANPEVLRQANPGRAALAVLALPDALINERVTKTMLSVNPALKVLARVHNNWEKRLLFDAGAFEVVQPEEEAGLQMVRQLILQLDLPREDILAYLETRYFKDYPDFVRGHLADVGVSERLKIRSFTISRECSLIGLSLRDSGIREKTGCSVVTIKREGSETVVNPHSHEIIRPGDTLIAMGSLSGLHALAGLLKEGAAS